MKKLIAVSALALFMGGCASNAVIPTSLLTDVADNAEHGLLTVADASVAKEGIVHRTKQKYIAAYEKAYSSSGTTITFGQVEKKVVFDGKELVYTENGITKIETREVPHFNVSMPDAPSVHPGWGMAERTLGTAIRWGFGTIIADGFFGMINSAWANAGTTYQGPVNMANSNNTAGNDQTFEAAAQYQGPVEQAAVSEESSTYPNDEWYSEGCSVESHAAGDC